ncbi:hypothetical protein TWF694_008161 [Orbilia ellipsospora]|uniref:Uncharacterized protein n=1 Tax=Orbilia ellipsospora TaxID=2528407 RepID=A0AAV9XGT0_9PEZI
MIFSKFASVLLALSSFAISVLATHCEANYNYLSTVTYCTTKSGPYKVYHIPTSFKTVTSKTSTTVTITPPPVTYTVTAPDTTVTDDVTYTVTVTKDSYKCPTKTIYVYTWVTLTHTITKVKTDYTSVTTTVVAYQTTRYDDHGHYKRHNNPPYPAPSFPTAIKCTKTVEITFTCSTTVYAPTVTVTQPGKYVTVTYTDLITKTVCPKKTKTITITHTKETETKVKTTTTKTKTFTVTIRPTPTPNPCGSHNQYRGPHGNIYADTFKWDPQFPAYSAEECCKLCFKHVNYAGVHDCAGSFFAYDKKHHKGKCFLKLTDKCYSNYKEPCKGAPKNYGYDGYVSNGPCGKWEYHN